MFAKSHRITSCLEGIHLFSLCRSLRDTRLLEVFPGTGGVVAHQVARIQDIQNVTPILVVE